MVGFKYYVQLKTFNNRIYCTRHDNKTFRKEHFQRNCLTLECFWSSVGTILCYAMFMSRYQCKRFGCNIRHVDPFFEGFLEPTHLKYHIVYKIECQKGLTTLTKCTNFLTYLLILQTQTSSKTACLEKELINMTDKQLDMLNQNSSFPFHHSIYKKIAFLVFSYSPIIYFDIYSKVINLNLLK